MTWSSNVSPVGWYVGTYLLRLVELAEQGNDDSDRRFLTWENTVLVKADNLDQAYEKVVRVAQEFTKPYKGGPHGIDVQWLFEGIIEIVPVYEEIEDGSEIMWSEHQRKLRNVRKRVRTKNQITSRLNGVKGTG